MGILYSIGPDPEGGEANVAIMNVDDGDEITTFYLPLDDPKVPLFLREAEVGDVFDEEGHALGDEDLDEDDDMLGG